MINTWFQVGRVGLVLCSIVASSTTYGAQNSHTHGSSHAQNEHNDHTSGIMASETSLSGQYAFATLSEIIAILRANPDTDWSKVDIASLREHLVDMHNVTIAADVSTEPVEGGALFTITSDNSEVSDSIRRMVSAHSEVMSSQNGVGSFRFLYAQIDEGAQLTVTSESTQDTAIIRALGFHGIMAEGDHHRHHHWMLATGGNPH